MNPLVLETAAWMLIHSMWQAAALALIVVLLGTIVDSPRWRHDLAVGGLVLTVVWSAYSALATGSAGLAMGPFAAAAAATDAPTVAAVAETISRTTWATMLVQAWFLGAMVSMGLVVRDAFAVRGIRRRAQTIGLPESVVQLAERSARRMGVSGVLVRLSEEVGVPTVTGIWRPIILLPASALGLTAEQLEAVLLHEFAHIRRRDLLIAGVVRAIKVVYFFNPAVWWLERRIRVERELCCDDLVVTAQIAPTVYARALLALAEHRNQGLALAATGGGLRHRIERLVGTAPRRRAHPLSAWVVALALLLVAPGSVAKPDLGTEIGQAAMDEDFDELRRLTALATQTGTVEEQHMAYVYNGEYWFGHDNARNALEWYSKALALPLAAESQAFSRYKVAWCHYNLGHPDESISHMTRAVDAGQEQIRHEGLKDLVRFFVDADREADGTAMFAARGASEMWTKNVAIYKANQKSRRERKE